MSDRLIRTQILLEPEQHKLLSELARNENRSLSDLVREMLQAQLEVRKLQAAKLLQRRLEALAHLKSLRQQILARHQGEPLALQPEQIIEQLREERDAQYFDNLR